MSDQLSAIMKVLPTQRIKLFWIVIIIIHCLKILGLAPFSVETPTLVISSSRGRMRTFQFSKFGQFYNILLILGSVGVILIHQDWSNQSTLSTLQALIAIRYILRYTSAVFIILNWAFRQRTAVRIMNGILGVEVRISGLMKQPSTKKSLVLLTVHVIINAFIWITFFTTIIIINSPDNPNMPAVIRNVLIVMQTIIYWFTVEYSLVVERIARDLGTVNRNLFDLKRFGNSRVSLSPFVNEFLQAFSSQTQSIQLAALRSLIGIRVKLGELAQEIENFFSFPILVCTCHTLLSLVLDVHDLIGPGSNSSVEGRLSRDFNNVSWSMVHAYPIVLLAANVTRTRNQAKLTAQIVREALIKPVGPEIKAELERFSLQLIHDDFTFTAYGFFALDYTMLHSMLAAMTSYLVILLQSQPPNGKQAQ